MGDLIDRDALEPFYEGGTDPDDAYADMTFIRAEHIENAPAVNLWIPCSERLPVPDTAVLISDDSRYVSKAWYDDVMHRFNISDSDYWYDESDVLAWMPLPDAYELPKKRRDR